MLGALRGGIDFTVRLVSHPGSTTQLAKAKPVGSRCFVGTEGIF